MRMRMRMRMRMGVGVGMGMVPPFSPNEYAWVGPSNPHEPPPQLGGFSFDIAEDSTIIYPTEPCMINGCPFLIPDG
ncbi:hypothetical protein CRG98_012661 [Punica granatum]|uniref:Uncharacterized protein n=1 Tax=Punica granatum TaxID=22663 RepID=A0A2I0KEG5_PUNGR|nr:hypothetical protein CRG98_012661 [Punica granatum]